MEDNTLFDMYSMEAIKAAKELSNSTPVSASTPKKEKLASRVLGGMKAAGVQSVTVDVNGVDVAVPRAQYVKALEDQVVQLRRTVREQEEKISRISRNQSKLVDEINRIRRELTNKIDYR